MRPFACPVTILNTIDHLGKFDGKTNEDFFVGYSLNSKAFKVFNSRTSIVEENLHIRFSENTPNVVGSRPDWLFDIVALKRTMNYELIVIGTQSNGFACTKASDNEGQVRKETGPGKDYILLPLWNADPPFSQDPKISHDDGSKPSSDNGKKVDDDPRKENECNDQEKEDIINSTNNVNTVSSTVNDADINNDNELPFDPNMPALEDGIIFNFLSDDEDDGAMADINNLDTTIQVSPVPTTRIHKDRPLDQVIRDLHSATQTRHMNKKDEKRIVIRDKTRLVAQRHTKEEGIDYDEVFAPVARIEAIRLFLAYASFKDFMRLSQNELNGTRIKSGFKRAFATLFGQDVETFIGTMFLNVEQLEKQLEKEDSQEIGSMAAFNVLSTIHSTRNSRIDERGQHKREYDSQVNERHMQKIEEKVDSLVETDDADIRPIYDEEPMAESQFLKEKSNEAKVKHDIDVIQTINMELEYKVAKLLKENETLKKHYKELFDSIKIKRAKTIEHTTSLIATNDNFKAQLQERGFAIATLKNELRKSTGNSMNTKFVKSSILGKPMLQSHRNQSVVRQPTAFKSKRPRISKLWFASQVDVNNNLSKPVTTHYFPKEREDASAKPHQMIASSNSRISSKNMPRFSSNDMVYNHYLKEAKKKTQECNRNSEPSLMPYARSQIITNGSKPKPRSNIQTSRNWPAFRIVLSQQKLPEIRIHDYNNEQSSSKMVPKVVPSADKTATS
nr:hypothetical protein [Tanacetum cinerariifolium]